MPVLWTHAVDAFIALLKKTMQPGDEIVMLPVQATYPGGRVKVKGTIVSVSGTAQLQPGQVVPVLIRGGVPHLAFAHSARRAQPGGLPRVDVFPLVEELFAVATPARDVYLRNHAGVWSLGLARFDVPGTTVRSLGWGPRGNRFFVESAAGPSQRWVSVFRLDRERGAEAPYRASEDPAADLVLERVHELHTDGTILAILGAGGMEPESVTVASCLTGAGNTFTGGNIALVRIDDQGHVVLYCEAGLSVLGKAEPFVDEGALLEPFVSLNFTYAIIHDITGDVRYLDSASVGTPWPIPQTAVGLLPQFAVPFSYGPTAEVTDGDSTRVFVCMRSVHPHTQRYRVVDFLVTEGRLQSWIGRMRREWFAQVGSYGTPGFNPPVPPDLCPGIPGIHFAFVWSAAPSEAEQLRIDLLSDALDEGLFFGFTDGHVIWKAIGAAPLELVDLATGAIATLDANHLPLQERGLTFLRPDWAFQPDATPTSAPEEERNTFRRLWDFGSGVAVVSSIATSDEDDAMQGLGVLAPIPEDVVRNTAVPRARHVLNDQATLTRRERFQAAL